MLLREYALIVKRRWWVLLLGALLVPAIWSAVDSRTPNEHHATTALLVSPADTTSGALIDSIRSQDLVESYANLVRRRPVLEASAATGRIPYNATELRARTSVTIVADTSIIEITVRSATASDAIESANTVAVAFVGVLPEIAGSNVVVVTVIEPAFETRTTGPVYARDIALGLFFGLIAGLLAAFAIEELDTRVRSARDLRIERDLVTLASIPKLSKRSALRPLRQDSDECHDAFGILEVTVTRLLSQSDQRVVLVTSALPNEGKTTVALNLAAAMANNKDRVVAVDGDLRNGDLLDRADIGDAANEVEWSGTRLSSTNRKGLYCLAADNGQSAAAVGAVVSRLRDHASYIIIDAPPILPLADVDTLAEHADAVLLVISAGVTTTENIQDALTRIERLPIPLLGAVLNRAHTPMAYYPQHR